MNLGPDTYAERASPLHRWDPRYKLVGLLALLFGFALVHDLRLLPAMLLLTAGIYGLSRLPISFLLQRLRYPGFFFLAMAVLLPFFSGETVLLHLGPLTLYREGLQALFLVGVKFVSILTLGIVLFGTAPFLRMVRAMQALGVPALLTDMMLFSYRYIYQVGDELETMERAMQVRGFRPRRPNRRTLGTLAALAGSLLVRSYEQSERVYKAMVLRGYGQETRPRASVRANFSTRPQDALWLGGVLLLALALVAAEMWLRGYG